MAGAVFASLAWVGVIALVSVMASQLSLFGGSDTSHYKVENVVIAPGGARRAVLYSDMGGGAAGWCHLRLLVDSTASTAPTAQRLERVPYDSLAFEASCGTDVSLAWSADTNLDVTYTLDRIGGTSTYQRPVTPDGAVRVRYFPRAK